jgi:hypothetical protein
MEGIDAKMESIGAKYEVQIQNMEGRCRLQNMGGIDAEIGKECRIWKV